MKQLKSKSILSQMITNHHDGNNRSLGFAMRQKRMSVDGIMNLKMISTNDNSTSPMRRVNSKGLLVTEQTSLGSS